MGNKYEIEVRIGAKPFVSSYATGKNPQEAAYSFITCFKPQSLINIGVDNVNVKDKEGVIHQFEVTYSQDELIASLTAI